MKLIDIQYPYSLDWDKVVVRMCEDGRRRVTLWRKRDGKLQRMGTTLARYLMAVHLGRYLTDDEIVDHKDEDKANDDIGNLQILSNLENILKNRAHTRIKRAAEGNPVTVVLECPQCEVSFMRPANKVRHKIQRGQAVCCSRRCGGIMSHVTKGEKVD